MRHREIIQKIKKWLHDNNASDDNNKPDEVLVALGFMIIGLNTDFVDQLSNRKHAELLQIRSLNLLRNYLGIKYKSQEKLSQFIGIISLTREAAEINANKRLFC